MDDTSETIVIYPLVKKHCNVEAKLQRYPMSLNSCESPHEQCSHRGKEIKGLFYLLCLPKLPLK